MTTGIPRGWRVKGNSETSHFYTDLRKSIFDKAGSCSQIDSALEDLKPERPDTRRCNLCEARVSSEITLEIIRRAWDTSD